MHPLLLAFLVVLGLVLGWVATRGVKSQLVRVGDVLLVGPLVVVAGVVARTELPTAVRAGLVLIGASTITYNLRNYIAHAHQQEHT